MESGFSEVFSKPIVLSFEVAKPPLKLFVLAEAPFNLLESAEAVAHCSAFKKGRRRPELGQRGMYHVPGFVAELVRTAAGAPNRNQGFTSPTNSPFPGARGCVTRITTVLIFFCDLSFLIAESIILHGPE